MFFQMITYTTQETVSHVLTQEGAQIALQGSHEARVWNACPTKGEAPPIPIKELQAKVGAETAKIGQGQAFKNKWIGKEGDGLVRLVSSLFWAHKTLHFIVLAGFRNRGQHPTPDAGSGFYRNPQDRRESSCRPPETEIDCAEV